VASCLGILLLLLVAENKVHVCAILQEPDARTRAGSYVKKSACRSFERPSETMA
jgi:hypothetical protein